MGRKNRQGLREASKNKRHKGGKIPLQATEVRQSTDGKSPVFSFKHVCDRHCKLEEWQNEELSELVATFKLMEQLSWKEIKVHRGLSYKVLDFLAFKLPSGVPDDITITEVRVCKKKRLVGYRVQEVFHIIWFDRNHEVCPENKVRRV